MAKKTTEVNTLNLTLPTLFPAQMPVLEAAKDNKHMFITFAGGRQCGKSKTGQVCVLYWALALKEQSIIVFAPTDAQCHKLYKDIIYFVEQMPTLIKSSKEKPGNAEIIFVNKSSIKFRSTASAHSLRGYSATHIWCDETAYINETTLKEDILPMLFFIGKKCLFTSTPFGRNFFFELYCKGEGGNKQKDYKSFKLTYKDIPLNQRQLDFIESQRQINSPEAFAQEYECKWTNKASCFTNIDELCILDEQSPKANEHYVVGIDIGFSQDNTCVIILNSAREMVYMDIFKQLSGQEVVSRLANIINFYKPQNTVLELNNQGISIFSDLKTQVQYPIDGIYTNRQNKNEMINALIYHFNRKSIHLLNNAQLIDELRAFQAVFSQGGVTFKSKMHDDTVMALAFANKAIENMYGQSEVTFDFF